MQVRCEISLVLSSIQYFLLCAEHLQCGFRFKKVDTDTNSDKEHWQHRYAELFTDSR